MQSDFQELITKTPLDYKQLAGKTVLVTGATGLIGGYLVNYLLYLNDNYLDKPINIICVARNTGRAYRKFNEKKIHRNLYFISLLDYTSFDGRKPDYIFHLASKASSDAFAKAPLDVFDANIFGTRQILDIARLSGAKTLFVSSGEVYGQGAPIPTPETGFGYIDLSDTRSCYAESKRAAEVLCICAAKEWGIDVRIARPFHSYGPGLDLQNDTRVFASFVKNIVRRQNIELRSDGLAIRSFLYLQDLITGFFTIMFKGKANEAYNVAGTPVSISGLAETLVKMYPEKNLKVIYNAPFSDAYLPSPIDKNIPDCAKLEALGWKQTVGLVEGFQRTIKYHTEFYT